MGMGVPSFVAAIAVAHSFSRFCVLFLLGAGFVSACNANTVAWDKQAGSTNLE